MSTRRRNDDSVRLYDFAKKNQENQNSSDMVKKQNAAEEKVLLARLEYLNNQKQLTRRTMEKEIDLVKRSSCSSGRETSRKSLSSYQLHRSFSLSLPNTLPGSTRESLSTGKCEKCFVSQIASRKMDISSPYRCKTLERKSSSGINDSGADILTIKSSGIKDSGADVLSTQTAQQYGNLSLEDDEEQDCVSEETVSDVPNRNSTRSRNLSPNSNTTAGTRMLRGVRADSNMTSHFTNNAWNENKREQISPMKQLLGQTRSNYSQAVETRRQEWMRTPTPFPKLGNKESLINRSLLQSGTTLVQSADRRNNQLRFSRTMTDLSKLTLRKTKSESCMHGVAAKDLRFKKLESVLVPI